MAPVVLALRERPVEFRVRVAVTAQHRALLDGVLPLFGIRPDRDLNLMRSGQSLTDVSVGVLAGLEPVLRAERPDLVLVHGDTTTSLTAALAAFYQQIPVGHVEAGLRSGDMENPFPEELNRRLTDGIAALHFAPTAAARRNLRAEGVPPGGIFVTGNTGIDALVLMRERIRRRPPQLPPAAARAMDHPFILLTAHRRENFGRPLENIFLAIRDAVRARPEMRVVCPVHPNPEAAAPARRILGGNPRVALIKPLEYGALVFLMSRARFVVTDSGGIQEEAPGLGKPVLVLRKVTERPEAVRAGVVRLVGADRAKVAKAILQLLENRGLFDRMAKAVNPYGDGMAAGRTVEALRFYFGFSPRRPLPFAP